MINKQAFIKSYNETGKGTSNKIPCIKCFTPTTMFGSNLANRIKKYGGLSNLLESFTCRKCISASKPTKPIKEKKVRKVKLHKKTNEQGEVVYDIPKMKWSTPRNVMLKDAPDLIEDHTKHSCAAPQLFLDNGRACYGCVYWNNCQCPIKTANEFACK